MGNRIYGCDDCLAVCPWNKFASQTGQTAFHAREELTARPCWPSCLVWMIQAFRQMFSGSPIKRIGPRPVYPQCHDRDRQFQLYLNWQPVLRRASMMPPPLVRAMAVWALGQLVEPEAFAELAKHGLKAERDEDVIAEWHTQQKQSVKV